MPEVKMGDHIMPDGDVYDRGIQYPEGHPFKERQRQELELLRKAQQVDATQEVMQMAGKTTTSFSVALNAVVHGKRQIRRQGWNGKDMFLTLMPRMFVHNDAGCAGNQEPYIAMYTAQGYYIPWLASQSDLLVEDWEIL